MVIETADIAPNVTRVQVLPRKLMYQSIPKLHIPLAELFETW